MIAPSALPYTSHTKEAMPDMTHDFEMLTYSKCFKVHLRHHRRTTESPVGGGTSVGNPEGCVGLGRALRR